ncbi:MAG: LPS export ABC transporter periplasmic protein LptC [Bacteroidetes bacterium]|nr:LPS export ABC transporter periplasmic protein LptC [Bacteroidota bacterium]MBS1592009.1 LPS export ABC transporter periplasmic protein LptC [Bacteroidota bacterium]
MLAIIFFIACENKQTDIDFTKSIDTKKIGVEEGYKIENYLSNAGKIKAALTAPYMQRYLFDTPRVVFPKTLHVNFFDSTGNIESQLFAKYGRYLEGENKVLLRDSVIAFTVKKDTLWTNELYWDQNTGKYYTDKLITLSQPGRQKVTAIGFESTQDFKEVKMFNVGKKFTGKESVIIVPDSTY